MSKATFLDPHFKTWGFVKEDCLERVKEKLQVELVNIIKKKHGQIAAGQRNEIEISEKKTICEESEDDSIISFELVRSSTALATAETRKYTEETNL